jgi:hypothetical protein
MGSLFLPRLYCRISVAAAAGLLTFVFLVGSHSPFSVASASFTQRGGDAPAFTVNRFRKGDRLPLFHSKPAGWRDLRSPYSQQTQDKAPLGCDPMVSPVNFHAPVMLYGRCMV